MQLKDELNRRRIFMDNRIRVQATFNSNDHAENYDRKARDSRWYAPEVAFGMAYKYISPGQSILDIGIGTGLSSILFAQAGLHVHGIDFSEKMLDVCRGKNFAGSLTFHDILSAPYPFEDNSRDHAISIGVFHLLDNPGLLLSEVQRIIRSDGMCLFTVLHCGEQDSETEEIPPNEIIRKRIVLSRHRYSHIVDLLESCGFELLDNLKFFGTHAGRESEFMLYSSRKR